MAKSRKPRSVNILGKNYSIEYVDKPSEVDVFKRESLWGQIDYWTRTIRIYDRDRSLSDLWETIIHEVIHGIVEEMKIKALDHKDKDGDKHQDLMRLSVGLADTFIRNGWLKV